MESIQSREGGSEQSSPVFQLHLWVSQTLSHWLVQQPPFLPQQPRCASNSWTPTTLCRACMLSRVQLFATPWAVALQAALSIGFSSKNTGVGYHALFQWIFLTLGSNPATLSLPNQQRDQRLLSRLIRICQPVDQHLSAA